MAVVRQNVKKPTERIFRDVIPGFISANTIFFRCSLTFRLIRLTRRTDEDLA